jgi:Arc/MetJ-type ribon-helix-helix transcriptional regulator
MSEEEVPFKSMKITLSDDVLEKLAELLKAGYFRSHSNAIEECIRTVFDIYVDMLTVCKSTPKGQRIADQSQQEAFRRYLMRMSRFLASNLQQK